MRPGEQEGYTLLEVLVAFVILAGAVIMSFRIFGDGLHRLNEADRQAQMVSVAQDLVAHLQLASSRAGGTTTGRSGEYSWTITLTPDDPQKDRGPQGVSMFRARVDVRQDEDSAGPSYSVETHLLAASQ